MYRTMYVGLLLIILVNPSGAQELSLAKAIETALLNNYDIQIQKADQGIAVIQNSWGTAGALPTVDFSLTDNFSWDTEFSASSETQRLSGAVTLNWLLFDGFAVQIRKNRLEDLQELSAGNTALLVENTIQSVISAYYNALLQREKLEVSQDVMQLSQDRYNTAQERHELGSQTQYELLQAQNAFLEDKARFLQQETTFRNSVRDINFLMGVSENIIYEFTDEFTIEPKNMKLDSLKKKMLTNNQTLENQYINQALLEKNVNLEQSAWWPSLSVRTGYEKSESIDANTQPFSSARDQEGVFATLSLSWRLFDGGNRQRAVEVAKVERESGQVSLASMKHSLVNRLYNFFELYQVRKELLDVADESLKAAELNLQISEEKFQAGAINSFNYRDVQLIYLNAAINRLNAVYNLIDAENALLKITGGIISEYDAENTYRDESFDF